MEYLDIQLVRPPVAVRRSVAAGEWALARAVVVGFCVHVSLPSVFRLVPGPYTGIILPWKVILLHGWGKTRAGRVVTERRSISEMTFVPSSRIGQARSAANCALTEIAPNQPPAMLEMRMPRPEPGHSVRLLGSPNPNNRH